MGQKSLTSTTPTLMRAIKEALMLFSNTPYSWKMFKTIKISSLITPQQDWKNAMKKSSGPKALSALIFLTTTVTSSFSNDLSNLQVSPQQAFAEAHRPKEHPIN